MLLAMANMPVLEPPYSPSQTPIVRFGLQPKVTEDMAFRMAHRLFKGLPLRLACAQETPVITPAHWHDRLAKSPKLTAIFDKELGRLMLELLEQIASGDLRHMPGGVWILERRFAEYFGQAKSQSVTINNTVIGLGQDILTRGQRLLKKQAIQQAIDVQSSTKPGTVVE